MLKVGFFFLEGFGLKSQTPLVMPFVVPVKTGERYQVMPLQNSIHVMPSEDGIHRKEKNKVLLIRTMDSDLRRNDFSILVMLIETNGATFL
ncbi:MAG: hypothetical protein LBM67_00240 [Lentimicrobiaceae bacterium]|jgi:hypothetical protein|nr:hypothetical protein [Lentimicrobiaceae bacterium]